MKENNIEEDVKYVKELLEIARVFFKAVKAETDYKNVDEIAFCNALENILAEREQKDKQIKELEEENHMQRKQLNDAFEKGFIHKDKVKEALEDIEDYFDRLNGPDEDIEYIRQVKKELLEGEK